MRNRNVMIKNIVICSLMLFAMAQGAFALPPDPDNAALVYYQAFLLYDEPEQEVGKMLRDFADGKIESNQQLKDYVAGCTSQIQLAVRAGDIPNCDWGLYYSDGFSLVLPHLSRIRQLSRIIIASARIEIEQGQYEKAMQLCQTCLKMSRHVGNDTMISFLVGCALDRIAYDCINDLMPHLVKQPEKLRQLKSELQALSSKNIHTMAPSLKMEVEVLTKYMKVDEIDGLFNALEDVDPNNLPDISQELLDKSLEYYNRQMDQAFTLLNSNESYEQMYSKLVEISEKAGKEREKNQAAFLTSMVMPSLSSVYGIQILSSTENNATMAALELYLIKSKTGKFPDKLPAGLPKDPFSGKDFKYEKTKSGFILKCGAKDLRKDVIHEFEFGISE